MTAKSYLNRLTNWLVNGGIKESHSLAKARAVRISNLIALSAVMNTMIFGVLFWYLQDMVLLRACVIVATVYTLTHLISICGYPDLGRPLNLIAGNIAIFYYANVFRGGAMLQLVFYSLSVLPFMFFSWEERSRYFLIGLSASLLVIGEYNEWHFFNAHQHHYNLKMVRVFSLIAPLQQIIAGFYYFLKQSTRFEAESNENLRKLEIEHRKQLQVQKMSSLGEMAGGISHEINNPLMVILGKTYNLKRDLSKKLPQDDPSFEGLAKIESMVHRIAKIIRALKNFSRNADHDPSEKVDLQNVIELTLDLCRERFNASGIALDVDMEDKIELYCRPTEISQVLLNLLNNAYDAAYGTKDAHVRIKSRKLTNDQIEITVEDNGSGIDPAIADKIMQPFFTTKEVGKGTGLGLSISKGIVESHKGKLLFIPRKGLTTFQILLPSMGVSIQ